MSDPYKLTGLETENKYNYLKLIYSDVLEKNTDENIKNMAAERIKKLDEIYKEILKDGGFSNEETGFQKTYINDGKIYIDIRRILSKEESDTDKYEIRELLNSVKNKSDQEYIYLSTFLKLRDTDKNDQAGLIEAREKLEGILSRDSINANQEYRQLISHVEARLGKINNRDYMLVKRRARRKTAGIILSVGAGLGAIGGLLLLLYYML